MEELGAGAAAQEEDFVVFGYVEQFAEQLVGRIHYLVEVFRAVRNREDRKPGSVEVEYGLRSLFDHFLRKN